MIQYRYSLDRSSKKFICPSCGKKTFVKYVDNTSNSYLDNQYGRCDRENKCKAHFRPYGNNKIDILQALKPKTPPSYHSLELVEKSVLDKSQNNFIDFLRQKFPVNDANKAITNYFLGTSRRHQHATIFWQIDKDENVHAGKIMLYDKETGKRKKSAKGKSYINWVHKIKTIGQFNLEQCLFGLHLTNDISEKCVALVESEKTAVIMSIFKPQYIWLATGSKHGFKEEMLQPIKEFKIVAFPDKGEYLDWKKTALTLNAMGFNIVMDEWLNSKEYKKGTDLADIYINEICKGIYCLI